MTGGRYLVLTQDGKQISRHRTIANCVERAAEHAMENGTGDVVEIRVEIEK